jgi:muconolactone delta-isomerase
LDALTRYRAKNKPIRAKLQMARKSAKLQRTPGWLTEFDLLKIKCLYQLAAMRTRESGYDWHVDHIIPLQGAFVSGLHVPDNLRVILAIDNMRKNNQYEV